MDDLVLQTLFCVTKTMVLTQSHTVQIDILRNLLDTWSQLFSNKNIKLSLSETNANLIETMMYDLFRQNHNIPFRNIVLQAILKWIFMYLPRINHTKPSISKIIILCRTLIETQPSFPIECPYILSTFRITRDTSSIQLSYHLLQEIITKYHRMRLAPSHLSDIKSILSHAHSTSNVNNPNTDHVHITLQILKMYCTNGANDCESDIDQMMNIMYSIASQHPPGSPIGFALLDIARHELFAGLYRKLPKQYRQQKNKQMNQKNQKKQMQRERYQNQLSCVMVNMDEVTRTRRVYHPMRVFGHGSPYSVDLSDQFNDISLDINRNRKQKRNQRVRCQSVPVYLHQWHELDRDIDAKDEDFKQIVNELEHSLGNDGMYCSNKKNARNRHKMAGIKRKLDIVTKNDDYNASMTTQRPSAPKKIKYSKSKSEL
eukprot:70389_1